MGLTTEEQKAVEEFRKSVAEPSMSKLVILDFWAEWCEPCKTLGPVLEAVAARYADKGVLLVMIDVDANRFIAGQFQVRSIPTVYAIFQGQPVANLTNARSETQLSQAIDQLLEKLPIDAAVGPNGDGPAADTGPLLAMAEDVIGNGDDARALNIFEQIAELDPANMEAEGGIIRALVGLGRTEEARARLDAVPDEHATHPAIERARAALSIAAERVDPAQIAALRQRLAENPEDRQARYELAGALIGEGEHDAAADELLAIIAAERDWNDGAARQKLLDLFEAVGLENEWTIATRRKLSEILFG